MDNEKIRLKTELNRISQRIYATKNQLERETDAEKKKLLTKEHQQLQRQALYYIQKLKQK
ncbi:hypothetical protein [Dethiobacter alkaliphilus]|uniref:Uncharacterized protein n=1 Tax=Dethiobacter alkaliphilus AHT 1 TaxID=555088 RepID=C0GEH3_DETAL|nr:hypothetical protein [Dethiobacter alkaliphilus]EEG78467.1 hypothetical protein DealDRAFT_0882 [Dethiobacter alkaliphilus AHT 1]MCW3490364.1 hypothetical protein [Dethiobacter alkaliphilus]